MSELVAEAVRLALGIEEMKARVAALNVANASKGGGHALRADLSAIESFLQGLGESRRPEALARLRQAHEQLRGTRPTGVEEGVRVDDEIGEMSSAAVKYQALGEALSRHFALLRLSVTGRN